MRPPHPSLLAERTGPRASMSTLSPTTAAETEVPAVQGARPDSASLAMSKVSSRWRKPVSPCKALCAPISP